MSNFFTDQNEKTEDIIEEQKEENSENSTIFADPSLSKTAKPIKAKKLLPKIIAVALCFCVLLGGTLLAKKLIPEKTEEQEETQKTETISVVETEEKDVSFVEVKNSKCEVKLNCAEQKSDSSDDSSDTETTYAWSLEGVSSEKTNAYLISSIAKSVYSIEATRKITEKTNAQCGLDNPVITATVHKTNDESFSVSVGGDSPDGSGCYLKTSLSDMIYLVDDEIKDTLTFEKLSLASNENIPSVSVFGNIDNYYTDGTLSKFDYITLSGANYPDTLKIVENDDEVLSSAIAYKITSPEERLADDVDSIISVFENGISISGAYSFDTDDASLAKFGLNSPDLVMSMGLSSNVLSYKFKLQDDGFYAVWCNKGNLIYKVAASSCESIVNGKPTDYYSPLVCIYSIDDIKGLTITGDKSYDFAIRANEDEDSEDKYVVTYKNKSVDCSSFQNFYQQIVSISCYDYTEGFTSTDGKITLSFTFNDGAVKTIEFLKNGESKYQCTVDGKIEGQISAQTVSKIIKNTEKLAKGEKIK